MKQVISFVMLLLFTSVQGNYNPSFMICDLHELNNNHFATVPLIRSIGGNTVKNSHTDGKWIGNASQCSNISNKYLNHFVVNTGIMTGIVWSIRGSNFGRTQGKGSIRTSNPDITLTNIRWADNLIEVTPTANYRFDSRQGVKITVRTESGETSRTIDVIGMIAAGRGYGQCTWEVAYQRKELNLMISKTSYGEAKSIDAKYAPQVGDQINFGEGCHSTIIIRKPIRTPQAESKVITGVQYDSLITYSFYLRERNHNCDENAATTQKTFVIRKDKSGVNAIIESGIRSETSYCGEFGKYYFR